MRSRCRYLAGGRVRVGWGGHHQRVLTTYGPATTSGRTSSTWVGIVVAGPRVGVRLANAVAIEDALARVARVNRVDGVDPPRRAGHVRAARALELRPLAPPLPEALAVRPVERPLRVRDPARSARAVRVVAPRERLLARARDEGRVERAVLLRRRTVVEDRRRVGGREAGPGPDQHWLLPLLLPHREDGRATVVAQEGAFLAARHERLVHHVRSRRRRRRAEESGDSTLRPRRLLGRAPQDELGACPSGSRARGVTIYSRARFVCDGFINI